MSRPDHVLVYDGDCARCRRWADRVKRWDRDRRVELVPAAAAAARVPQRTREDMDRAMILVGPDGTISEGADALEHLLELMPRGRILASLFRLPAARRVARRLYAWIARRRRRDACAIHAGCADSRRT